MENYNLENDYADWMKNGHGNRSEIQIMALNLWNRLLLDGKSKTIIKSSDLLEELIALNIKP